MDVNRTLVSALCGGGEGGAGDYEFGPGEGDLGLQALLSIQPQIVDACERAFLRAIQQENEEERPGKKGKGL
jgi:hypothetical protein